VDKIKEVYEKWKHCDKKFSDRFILPDDVRGDILYELWQAVRAEATKEEKVLEREAELDREAEEYYSQGGEDV